jgi:hypothetical protein
LANPQHQSLSTNQAFSTIFNPRTNFDLDSHPDEQHFDDTTSSLDPDQNRSIASLPLEHISCCLPQCNFQNLIVGSLRQTWNDHVLSPTIEPNTWPLWISISKKRARNKTPQRQGTKPFHCLHLDLMQNPFRYGLTSSTNHSAYLYIVSTSGKLTGWICLPLESTASIIIALKQWLTDTELLGRTHSVWFIHTDTGSAFTSTKFISKCTSLGIKVEAAAPEIKKWTVYAKPNGVKSRTQPTFSSTMEDLAAPSSIMPMPMQFKSAMSVWSRMVLTKMAIQQRPINTAYNASLTLPTSVSLAALLSSNTTNQLSGTNSKPTNNNFNALLAASSSDFLTTPKAG